MRLAIDANLLVLYVVGLCSIDLITKHKRTRQFDRSDFVLLEKLICSAQAVVVTPNVLTEASNLCGLIGEPVRTNVLAVLGTIIHGSSEQYIPSTKAVECSHFSKLGLTDSVLLSLEDQNAVVLTTDLDLYIALQTAGRDAINFNHIRDSY